MRMWAFVVLRWRAVTWIHLDYRETVRTNRDVIGTTEKKTLRIQFQLDLQASWPLDVAAKRNQRNYLQKTCRLHNFVLSHTNNPGHTKCMYINHSILIVSLEVLLLLITAVPCHLLSNSTRSSAVLDCGCGVRQNRMAYVCQMYWIIPMGGYLGIWEGESK